MAMADKSTDPACDQCGFPIKEAAFPSRCPRCNHSLDLGTECSTSCMSCHKVLKGGCSENSSNGENYSSNREQIGKWADHDQIGLLDRALNFLRKRIFR